MANRIYYPIFKAFTSAGAMAAGYKLWTYEAGTSTPLETYTTSAGDVANPNPIILNALGEAEVFVTEAVKLTLMDTADATQDGWPVDNIDPTTVTAEDVGFTPAGGLISTNVQDAVEEVNTVVGTKADADASGFETSGTVKAWPTDSVPTGYLECDGSAVSRATYPNLFGEIAEIYGVGDGSTTFNLPDYRGEFLRGYDNSSGTDPDAATRTDSGDGTTTGDNVGTKQADAFDEHTHSNQLPGNTHGITTGTDQSVPRSGNGTTGATGGNETRPTNVAVMWIIKY